MNLETHNFQSIETNGAMAMFCTGCGEIRLLELPQTGNAQSDKIDLHAGHTCGECDDPTGCGEDCL